LHLSREKLVSKFAFTCIYSNLCHYDKVVDTDGKPVPPWDPASTDDVNGDVNGDDDSKPGAAPPAVVGEVWVKGPTLCAGYWNRPAHEAAAAADDDEDFSRDGWFRTVGLYTLNPVDL
jgi:long-subunit acyl-CoA synthetase (AMP-forming)